MSEISAALRGSRFGDSQEGAQAALQLASADLQLDSGSARRPDRILPQLGPDSNPGPLSEELAGLSPEWGCVPDGAGDRSRAGPLLAASRSCRRRCLRAHLPAAGRFGRVRVLSAGLTLASSRTASAPFSMVLFPPPFS